MRCGPLGMGTAVIASRRWDMEVAVRRISDMEGVRITGRKGKPFGRVTNVLFAPREPRVVGYEVQPPSLGYVIERKPRYLMMHAVERVGDGMALRQEHAREKPDYSWDDSVVWRYMPVISESGKALGFVRDAEFSESDGSLSTVWLSYGTADDMAVGGRTIAGATVLHFDGEAVVVVDQVAKVRVSGGSAKTAGRGAAIAMIAAEETARQAVGGAVRIVKAVKKAEVSKRARGGWQSFKDSIAEGMKDDG